MNSAEVNHCSCTLTSCMHRSSMTGNWCVCHGDLLLITVTSNQLSLKGAPLNVMNEVLMQICPIGQAFISCGGVVAYYCHRTNYMYQLNEPHCTSMYSHFVPLTRCNSSSEAEAQALGTNEVKLIIFVTSSHDPALRPRHAPVQCIN